MKRLFLVVALVVAIHAKDREWTEAKIVSVTVISKHWMAGQNASVEYTVRASGTDYVAADAAKSYVTTQPKPFLKAGDAVSVSLEKSHVRIRLPSGEKRLRITRKTKQ